MIEDILKKDLICSYLNLVKSENHMFKALNQQRKWCFLVFGIRCRMLKVADNVERCRIKMVVAPYVDW